MRAVGPEPFTSARQQAGRLVSFFPAVVVGPVVEVLTLGLIRL